MSGISFVEEYTPKLPCKARGCSFEDRLALGYQASCLKMPLTYSRDGAARPLQVLSDVLEEIRAGVFAPDSTRGGRLTKPPSQPSHVARSFMQLRRD